MDHIVQAVEASLKRLGTDYLGQDVWSRVLYGGASILCLITTFLTLSRAGLIALVFGLGVVRQLLPHALVVRSSVVAPRSLFRGSGWPCWSARSGCRPRPDASG